MTSFGFVGFGELGFEVARGLAEASGQDGAVSAYVRPRETQSAEQAIAAKFLAAGPVKRCQSVAELVVGTDVVVAAVPCGAAREVAIECLPFFGHGSIYVDPSPLGPTEKAQLSALLAARGVAYVDAAVMGAIPTEGYGVPILACGPGAAPLSALVSRLGMHVTVIDGTAGRATLVKLLRSVYMKGRDALVLEMLLAARRYGVDELVIDSIQGAGERVSFRDLANRVMCALAIHAGRRADELATSAQIMREGSISPILTQAGWERLHGLAQVGLREHFASERPKDSRVVLEAIDSLAPDGFPRQTAQPEPEMEPVMAALVG
jgi:3-hydroxyisobutyrate dehydrogenase-like beta-hydroxyacid dehydrogenase